MSQYACRLQALGGAAFVSAKFLAGSPSATRLSCVVMMTMFDLLAIVPIPLVQMAMMSGRHLLVPGTFRKDRAAFDT